MTGVVAGDLVGIASKAAMVFAFASVLVVSFCLLTAYALLAFGFAVTFAGGLSDSSGSVSTPTWSSLM